MKTYSGEDRINGKIWYHYPVVTKYKTVTIFAVSPHHFFRVKIGKQDDKIVSGYDYELNSGLGGGCNPGRKWGEFDSYDEALEYELNKKVQMLQKIKEPNAAEKDALRRILKFVEAKFIQKDLFDSSY